MRATSILTAVILSLSGVPAQADDPKPALVRERGAVESGDAVDVVAPELVRNARIQSTIKWIAEDGAMVKKGEKIIELDDAAVRERITQLEIAYSQAAARVAAGETELKLMTALTRKRLDDARSEVELAQLEIKSGATSAAHNRRRLELKQKQADLAVSMAKATDEKKKEPESRIALELAEVERELIGIDLRHFDESQLLAGKAAEVRLKRLKADVEVAELESQPRLAQTEAQLAALRVGLAMQKDHLARAKDDLAHCTIRAPQDGLLVYFVPEQSRFGGGGSIVAQGEPVIAGQKLFRIAGLKKFNVATMLPESLVSKVRPGQPAQVRIDAIPNVVIAGKVHAVAVVATVNRRQPDVKLYSVTIALDDPPSGLKPGMSAEATININPPR